MVKCIPMDHSEIVEEGQVTAEAIMAQMSPMGELSDSELENEQQDGEDLGMELHPDYQKLMMKENKHVWPLLLTMINFNPSMDK